jgi:chromosome segregation ATPase
MLTETVAQYVVVTSTIPTRQEKTTMLSRRVDEHCEDDEDLDIDTLLGKVDALEKANKDLKKTRDSLKKDKLNLNELKKDLEHKVEYLNGRIKKLDEEKKALKHEIDSVWTEMVAYSLIRGYPQKETVVRTKRGSTNRGIFSILSCVVD